MHRGWARLRALLGQVAQAFPAALGVMVTAGEEGAAYCFRSPTKGEASGFCPTFKVCGVPVHRRLVLHSSFARGARKVITACLASLTGPGG